jgi:hypothetical protein
MRDIKCAMLAAGLATCQIAAADIVSAEGAGPFQHVIGRGQGGPYGKGPAAIFKNAPRFKHGPGIGGRVSHRGGPFGRGGPPSGSDDDGDSPLPFAVLGFVAGTIFGSAVASSSQGPIPEYDEGPYAVPPDGQFRRGSASWFEYCSQRYRSFDFQTGTYLGRDGQRHVCSP